MVIVHPQGTLGRTATIASLSLTSNPTTRSPGASSRCGMDTTHKSPDSTPWACAVTVRTNKTQRKRLLTPFFIHVPLATRTLPLRGRVSIVQDRHVLLGWS